MNQSCKQGGNSSSLGLTCFPLGVAPELPAEQQMYSPNAPKLRHAPPPVECGKNCLDLNKPRFLAVFSLFCKKIKQFAAIDAFSPYYIIVMGAQKIPEAKRKSEY